MIDSLITEAIALKPVSYDSPKVKLWKRRAREYVRTEFGDDYLKILNSALLFNRVIRDRAEGQAMHIEAMEKAVEFLEGLRSEEPSPALAAVSLDTLRLGLHNAFAAKCGELLEAGHYAEAVEKAFKIVRDLRELTGFETGSEAFGKGSLRISGAAAPHVEEDFNEAVKFLTMAIDRWKHQRSRSSSGVSKHKQPGSPSFGTGLRPARFELSHASTLIATLRVIWFGLRQHRDRMARAV
jgi:hypothetical protein